MHRFTDAAPALALAVALALALACGDEVREREVAEVDEIDQSDEEAREPDRPEEGLEVGERSREGEPPMAGESGEFQERTAREAPESGERMAARRPESARPGAARTAPGSPGAGEAPRGTGFRDDRGGVYVITADLGEMAVLVPATIVVTSGADSTLRIRNTGAQERTLRVNGLGIEASLPAGEETHVQLSGLEEGTIYGVALRSAQGSAQEVATLVVLPGQPESGRLPQVSSPPPTGRSQEPPATGAPGTSRGTGGEEPDPQTGDPSTGSSPGEGGRDVPAP